MVPLTGPVDEMLRDLRRYRELGVAHVALWPAGRFDRADAYIAAMERLAREIVGPLRSDPSRAA